MDVAYNVSDDEWEPVYEESLYLAKKFKLMDFHELELFGDQLYCGVPVEEQAEADERFWSTIGDYEKRSKVKSRIIASAIKDLMAQSESVLIMGHRASDLDALGSAVGMLPVSYTHLDVYKRQM